MYTRNRRIIINRIMCNYCGDVLTSNHRHDFKTCSCGTVSVDGGNDYLRRCAKHNRNDFTDLSEYSKIYEIDTHDGNVNVSGDCLLCKNIWTVSVNKQGYFEFQCGNLNMAMCFPDSDELTRECLLSGICPTCQERLLKEKEELHKSISAII